MLLSAHFDILPTINGGGPFVPRVFSLLLFGALRRGYLTFFQFLHCPFLFQLLHGVQSNISERRRRRRGKIGRNLGLGNVFRSFPLVPVGY